MVERLLAIMARLRDPELGCPWDRQQDFASIAPYTIEEAYEVAQAIADDDLAALRQELGDLLFQVVFHSRLAEEQGSFDFSGVVEAICDKMERRHPHVFADAVVQSADEQHQRWEQQKRHERRQREQHGVLDDVPLALPALMRAQKLQKRASRVGFDWHCAAEVVPKVEEELAELQQALRAAQPDPAALAEEGGDLLFSCVNLLRHCGIDAEEALRQANRKFEHRFAEMERLASACGEDIHQLTADGWEEFWQAAKRNLVAGKASE